MNRESIGKVVENLIKASGCLVWGNVSMNVNLGIFVGVVDIKGQYNHYLRFRRIVFILLIVISFNLTNSFGQIDTVGIESECKQYIQIMKFVESDTSYKFLESNEVIKIKVDTVIMNMYYLLKDRYLERAAIVSLDTDIPMNQIKSDTVRKYWKKFENIKDTLNYKFNCNINLKKERNPNLFLTFYRFDSNYVLVRTMRFFEKRRHSYGFYYLFKFDINYNMSYRQWGWIE